MPIFFDQSNENLYFFINFVKDIKPKKFYFKTFYFYLNNTDK